MKRSTVLFRTILTLVLAATPTLAQEPMPPKLTPQEQRRDDEAIQLDAAAGKLYEQGKLREAAEEFRRSLMILEEVYAKDRFPNGHSRLAYARSNIGGCLMSAGAMDAALVELEKAVKMFRVLTAREPNDEVRSGLAVTLNNLGYVEKQRGNLEHSRDYYREALELFRRMHPPGHSTIAAALNNLGALARVAGNYEEARRHLGDALAMRRAQFPGDHALVAQSLSNLASLEEDAGRYELAREKYEQVLAMRRRLFPPADYAKGHQDLAASLNNLGILHRRVGNYDLAKQSFDEALVMYRALVPKEKFRGGHPFLHNCLNNYANLLSDLRENDRARELFEESLAMLRARYPQDKFPDAHPDIALTLNNLATLISESGKTAEAKLLVDEALAIDRVFFGESKYPKGHLRLASSIHHAAIMRQRQQDYESAKQFYAEALRMGEQLYPPERFPAGHPHLAHFLQDIGSLQSRLGADAEAMPALGRAFAMRRALADRFVASSSESESLAYLETQTLARDLWLSATARVPDSAPAAYQALWPTRAGLTRVLEQRYAAARAAGTEQHAKLELLRATRRRLDQLLQNTGLKPAEKDRLLTDVSAQRDRLERELMGALPALGRWKQRDVLGPDDLARELPVGSAFVDIVQYVAHDFDPSIKGKRIAKVIPRYTAFVVTRGRAIRRVELGEAAGIDAAVSAWRRAIENRDRTEAPAELTRIWTPIANLLPEGTRNLYLAVDGNLARLPWAALPVGSHRVLLEDLAVATVPHGLFLLEKLKFPGRNDGADALLALGDVDYGASPWIKLPGTSAEMKALRETAGAATKVLSQKNATSKRLADGLTSAHWAHLATHGFFDAEALTTERRRAEQRLRAAEQPSGVERRLASMNPLGFVGLVLSDGEVMSGLSLLDLNLEQLKLVTLSACETGVGQYTAAKGVEGLQLAFHLAGCPNVVASLWKVNDAATAALMTKFYHELWANKKPPIEALREAQLTIYRHPELIPDLAGERGPPSLKAAVSAKIGEPAGVGRRVTADTKLWAAFVLSGVGK